MPEWTNGTVSKTVRGASLSGVQIPPLPPFAYQFLVFDYMKSIDRRKIVETAVDPHFDDIAI